MDKGGRPCGKSAATLKREREAEEKANPETRQRRMEDESFRRMNFFAGHTRATVSAGADTVKTPRDMQEPRAPASVNEDLPPYRHREENRLYLHQKITTFVCACVLRSPCLTASVPASVRRLYFDKASGRNVRWKNKLRMVVCSCDLDLESLCEGNQQLNRCSTKVGSTRQPGVVTPAATRSGGVQEGGGFKSAVTRHCTSAAPQSRAQFDTTGTCHSCGSLTEALRNCCSQWWQVGCETGAHASIYTQGVHFRWPTSRAVSSDARYSVAQVFPR